MNYIVYEFYIIETGEIFYVGQGKNGRNKKVGKNDRSRAFWEIYITNKCASRILYDNLTEEESWDLEKEIIKKYKPKRAIILAAGICTRMVPLNSSVPKALLKINGEVIIEKQIQYLHDVGIKEIYVVVGYMKEKFEYLIDKYNVELIVNPLYNIRNTT